MKITADVRAWALEQAGRRCECDGDQCGHHRNGARCTRGLRGDAWKVFWRTERGGTTRDNLSAWCTTCFENNYEVPRETVALLAPNLVGYARLIEENRRRAITLSSVLRDAARNVAAEHRGRLVLERQDDDLLLEFGTCEDAVAAAMSLRTAFREMAERLDLPSQDICGVIHTGEVTRWRSGVLVGDAVELASRVKSLTDLGQFVLTGKAAEPLRGSLELERIDVQTAPDEDVAVDLWAIRST